MENLIAPLSMLITAIMLGLLAWMSDRTRRYGGEYGWKEYEPRPSG